MEMPYLTELVRRLRPERLDGGFDISENGAASVIWRPAGVDHWVTLLVSERELATAVTALGEDCRGALWPGSGIEEAGFNILLVHLEEVIATRDTTAPLRITSEGLLWPEDHRS